MPRYFFHVSGILSFTDKVGVELRDDDAAWAAAIIACGGILADLDTPLPERAEVRITVKDSGKRLVAVARFIGERRKMIPLTPILTSPSLIDGVYDRIVAEIDVALDWIKDVHDPKDYGPFSSNLALAALASLEEGDRIGNGLVVRKEALQ